MKGELELQPIGEDGIKERGKRRRCFQDDGLGEDRDRVWVFGRQPAGQAVRLCAESLAKKASDKRAPHSFVEL